ncbi:MAG TPA: ABC transporter ATP-binding protein [Flavitalea sp.]|nr:ABC transporter ATP-binding protein [Flavitalea sp.]
MSNSVIKLEHISKKYRLGTIGTGTLSHDLNQWWAKLRGKADGYEPLDGHDQSKIKGDFWALRNLSFDVEQGDTLGIIGKNGAGKSTVLKILSRITSPTTGQVKIKGRIASLLEVGTGFHHELTGRENIFLNGAILGMRKREIQRKLDEIIAFSGVEQHIDTPVKRYSSGMYVRLAFAVAAHLEPEILIVDEVLAVGDAEFQKKCLGKMSEVAKQGRTVLFVSHNMGVVKNLCNRGILLEHGKIVLDGSMPDVINAYGNLLAGSSKAEVRWPMNEAPGNDNVRMVGVRVLNCRFQVSDSLHRDEELFIEVDFVTLKENGFFSINVQLFDGMGISIFYTSNRESALVNEAPFSTTPYNIGTFRSRVTIPANLLNEGTFIISVIIMQELSSIASQAKEVITFNIIDSGEMKQEMNGQWPGVIRPKLTWTTGPISLNHIHEKV